MLPAHSLLKGWNAFSLIEKACWTFNTRLLVLLGRKKNCNVFWSYINNPHFKSSTIKIFFFFGKERKKAILAPSRQMQQQSNKRSEGDPLMFQMPSLEGAWELLTPTSPHLLSGSEQWFPKRLLSQAPDPMTSPLHWEDEFWKLSVFSIGEPLSISVFWIPGISFPERVM